MIPLLERLKTVRALDSATIGNGCTVNGLVVSITGEEYLDQMSDCWVLRKDIVP
jgi:hypothetical protein